MSVSINRNASLIAARMAGESSAMDVAAERVANKARELARQHVETGHFEASIHTAKTPGRGGVTDRVAYTDDPAALSIEFGHVTSTGKRVPGQLIFTRAAREA